MRHTNYLILVFLAVILFSSCKEPVDDDMIDPVDKPAEVEYNWAGIADTAQNALISQYWSPGGHYFNQNNTGNTNFNYWWNAHGLDVLIDAYSRTKDEKYKILMDELHAGMWNKNGNTYLNDYYDDMEWMALACLRAYSLTNDIKYKNTAETLWADIKTGWSEELGGGIAWRKSQRNYKNTPANAPASILAARLYQLNNNPADLEWAVKIYNWQKNTLVDPSTGLVWDGINRQGNNQIDKDWKFTYCQGVFIGAALELFKITKQEGYLNDANKTASYVINDSQLSPNGLLKDEGNGDGGLFKGILVRYLTQLIIEGNLNASTRNKYAQFLEFNGETLWSKGTNRSSFLFGTNWSNRPANTTDSSTQMSGVMLVEALARLDDLGLLD